MSQTSYHSNISGGGFTSPSEAFIRPSYVSSDQSLPNTHYAYNIQYHTGHAESNSQLKFSPHNRFAAWAFLIHFLFMIVYSIIFIAVASSTDVGHYVSNYNSASLLTFAFCFGLFIGLTVLNVIIIVATPFRSLFVDCLFLLIGFAIMQGFTATFPFEGLQELSIVYGVIVLTLMVLLSGKTSFAFNILKRVQPVYLKTPQFWFVPAIAACVGFILTFFYAVGGLAMALCLYFPEDLASSNYSGNYTVFIWTLYISVESRAICCVIAATVYGASYIWTVGTMLSVYRSIVANYTLHAFGAMRNNRVVPLSTTPAPAPLPHILQSPDILSSWNFSEFHSEETKNRACTVMLRALKTSIYHLGPHAYNGAWALPRAISSTCLGDRKLFFTSQYTNVILAQYDTTLGNACEYGTNLVNNTIALPTACSPYASSFATAVFTPTSPFASHGYTPSHPPSQVNVTVPNGYASPVTPGYAPNGYAPTDMPAHVSASAAYAASMPVNHTPAYVPAHPYNANADSTNINMNGYLPSTGANTQLNAHTPQYHEDVSKIEPAPPAYGILHPENLENPENIENPENSTPSAPAPLPSPPAPPMPTHNGYGSTTHTNTAFAFHTSSSSSSSSSAGLIGTCDSSEKHYDNTTDSTAPITFPSGYNPLLCHDHTDTVTWAPILFTHTLVVSFTIITICVFIDEAIDYNFTYSDFYYVQYLKPYFAAIFLVLATTLGLIVNTVPSITAKTLIWLKMTSARRTAARNNAVFPDFFPNAPSPSIAKAELDIEEEIDHTIANTALYPAHTLPKLSKKHVPLVWVDVYAPVLVCGQDSRQAVLHAITTPILQQLGTQVHLLQKPQ